MNFVPRHLANQRGVSLVELVLYIVISGILFGVSAQAMMSNLDTYSFISKRKSCLSAARYAINRMSYELLRVGADDITGFDSDSIAYVDADGEATSFSLQDGSLYRGDEVLMQNVGSFEIVAYDSNDQEVADVAAIRKLQFTLTSAAVADEGSITLATMVTPRSLIYAGFQ